MKPKLYKTSTGEFTLYLEELDETYHSRDGAISESFHVFIKNGLHTIQSETTKDISILELGFGTGLNALLSCLEANKSQQKIIYTGIEAYPLEREIIEKVDYSRYIEDKSAEKIYTDIHGSIWNSVTDVSQYFSLLKLHQKIEDADLVSEDFDIVYFDAFAPKKQSELWKIELLEKLYHSLAKGGILVTYSAAGQLKRNLKALNFKVQNPPGANGKREMTVARKF